MNFLDRTQIEALVRELEAEPYGLALELTSDREAAGRAVLGAFASTAPFLVGSSNKQAIRQRLSRETRRELRSASRPADAGQTAPSVSVPANLHLQLVDIVEERQHDEPLGRKKLFVASLGGLALLALLSGYALTRWTALGAAAPVISERSPASNASEVPVQGNLFVRFSRAPIAKPSIRIQPAAAFDSVDWDGHTLLVGYTGLHLTSNYTLTLEADYRSRFGDTGHLVQQWRFTTEGYPVLVKVTPAQGAAGVFRYGQLSIEFNHRPTIDPTLSLRPLDGVSIDPGRWSGSVWTITYSGLKPLSSYQATVAVDYGVKGRNIFQTWSFTTEPGVPPPGVPVIWYTADAPYQGPDPSTPKRWVALDWSGRLVGTIYGQFLSQQSPDGSVLYDAPGSFIDSTGKQLQGSLGYYKSPLLADDNLSSCQVAPGGAGSQPYELWLYSGRITSAPRPVAPAGSQGGELGGVELLACSVLNNRAVIVDHGPQGAASVRVLQLSSGRLLYQKAYPAFPGTTLRSSRDGRYLSEDVVTVDNQGQPTGSSTLIRSTADGTVVRRLGNVHVVRFSWDGSRVLITAPRDDATRDAATEVQLLDWKTGKILWRLALASGDQGVIAYYRQNAPDMAVAIASQPQSSQPDQLWLVHADGSASLLVNGSVYAAFFGLP